jgi:hypothetical protein
MHELTNMQGNIFTVKLHDIVIPVTNGTDLYNFDSIFIVMDLVERDISSLFLSGTASQLFGGPCNLHSLQYSLLSQLFRDSQCNPSGLEAE